MQVRSLQTRIAVAFVALICVSQVASVVIVNMSGVETARKTLADELTTAERFFNSLMEKDAVKLEQGARIVATDEGLQNAIRSGDGALTSSILRHLNASVGAEATVFVGSDQRVAADTLTSTLAGRPFPAAALLRKSAINGVAKAMVALNGTIYQLVMVPILTPQAAGWVGVGYILDDEDARDLKKVTGLQVNFFARHDSESWLLAGSTLPKPLAADLTARVNDIDAAALPSGAMTIGGVQYMTLITSEGNIDGLNVIAVLQRPVSEAMQAFNELQQRLFVVTGIVLALSLLSSLLIARGIARPVQALAHFARRIANGEQREPLDIERNDEIGALAVAFDDMRERISEREAHITKIAYRDAVTGLPNRTLFSDRLQQAIHHAARTQGSLTVVMMDLDRFKEVNDSLGHQAGDELLMEVGRRLQGTIRRKSDTIARMGGDEFAVLLPTEGARDVMGLMQKLQECFETPVAIEGGLVDTRASIGMAVYPAHGEDLDTLLRHADAAMYVAKRNGSGLEIYDPTFADDSRDRLSLMTDLRNAVANDELVLHYQPKISLADPAQLHVEALVRWQHATRGFVAPDLFIPFAERTGFITLLTDWVVDHACAQLRRWRDAGVRMHVAVNVSTRDLKDPAFFDRVTATLATHRCDPTWIAFEITETSILGNPGPTLENLNRLHALGCRISIDDFGTGYSSLAYLSKLPVDELKIDRSFVTGMIDKPSDAAIVRSTIDLGHNMGLTVVAEGVETDAMLQQLTDMGCDVAQGYLISRPLTAAALDDWLVASGWIRQRQAAVPADELALMD